MGTEVDATAETNDTQLAIYTPKVRKLGHDEIDIYEVRHERQYFTMESTSWANSGFPIRGRP